MKSQDNSPVKWELLSHVQLFATLWTTQSMEFFRPEYWSGKPFPSPGSLPNPGIKPRSPASKVDYLPGESQGKPNTPVQFSSVQLVSRVWLCNPMNCSTPGLPVHHQLPEFTQTHVHWVSDAIQPSHPLSFPSPPTFNLSSIRVFFGESALCIRWPKY